MDILHLVDRLEELFNESRPIWFTHSVIVDEDRMLDLIDQMRVSIPEEIKKAQQLLANRDRLLAQAQEEASRTVQLARDRADQVVDRDPIVQAAQVRAEQIIAQARAEAELTRREADDYVQTSLSNLLKELERLTSQVNNGIQTLQSEKLLAQQPKE
jgi:fructose-specific phosphotransferase system component IIB